MIYAIIISFLLLIPTGLAISCTSVAEKDLGICTEIMQSFASETEKQDLVADLVYHDKRYANHSFVFEHNTGITFQTAPQGTTMTSSLTI